MATTKYMGANQLLDRLTAQVGSPELAKALLIKRGHMTNSGALTEAGQARNSMTAEERAKDRMSKASGKPASAYGYDAKTNQATLQRSKKGLR